MLSSDIFRMTINGQFVDSDRKIDVIDPATGAVFARAPDCTQSQLDLAITSAGSAFKSWKLCTYDYRQQVLCNAAEVLMKNADELAKIFTREHGRPFNLSLAEIYASVEWIKEASKLRPPVTVFEDSEEQYIECQYQPLGVVAAIAPWNFPILLAIWKIAPAILAGNTVVLKPSPFTPLTTLKMAEMLNEVFPPGVLNVVSGNESLGPMLSGHRDINKISFTGSTRTGMKVLETAAKQLVRVTLELGGNDAAIVCDDVDPLKVAPQLFVGAFHNSAQVCIATKRLYVHERIYEEVRDNLVNLAKKSVIGGGFDEGVELGPIQNKRQYDFLCQLLEDTKNSGIKIHLGNEVPSGGGYFFPIVIVDDPPSDSRVVMEEAFGPILPIIKFRNIDDVIDHVNDCEYGLASAVWCNDLKKATEIARRIESGTTWVNHNLNLRADIPFAGHKKSGFGVENGVEGLLEFMSPKTLYIAKKTDLR